MSKTADGEAPEDGTEQKIDPDWMIDYRHHAMEAFIAGCLICIVSRMSHILAKPGALRHEAYMSLYSYVITACVMPLLILISLRYQEEKRKTHFLEDVPIYARVLGIIFLFSLLLVKNLHMERGIMKRFVEDYDPERHEKFPFTCGASSDVI